MPKIIIVSPTANLGGAERILHSVATHLVDEGWEVTFFIMSRGYQEGWEDLEKYKNFNFVVSNYKSEKKALPFVICHLISLCFNNKYDYALSSHTHTNAMLSFLRKLKLIQVKFLLARESTVIFDRFSGFLRKIFYFIYRFFYGAQDVLVCQTDYMRSSLIEALGFKPSKNIVVIPNPINLHRIDVSLGEFEVGFKEKHLSKKKTIVFCGRLVPVKKVDTLIFAFNELLSLVAESKLVIIGDGPEKEKLVALSKSLNIKEFVNFVGYQKNPACLLMSADLGVVSSEREGFPNVILEMMASGVKSIVSTPCTDGLSCLPDIIVSSDHSHEALSQSMYQALKNNYDFSKVYREYVEKERSVAVFWEAVVASSKR